MHMKTNTILPHKARICTCTMYDVPTIAGICNGNV